jgi:RNA polymerase primary sigma factor
MINYATYCTGKSLSKKEQKNIFKEIANYKNKIAKRKSKRLEQKITDLNNQIVFSYIPFVIKAIQKYNTNQAIDQNDLLHEGILGLYYAVTKFNYKRNNKFLTYALPWVNLKIYLASKQQYSLKVSPHFLRKFRKYKKIESMLKKEVLDEKNAHLFPVSYISLQDVFTNDGHDEHYLSDTIPDQNANIPSDMSSQQDTLSYVERAINTLDKDEQYIIKNRFGFNGDKQTLEEISKELNVTKEYIFAKQKAILNKLSYRIKENPIGVN